MKPGRKPTPAADRFWRKVQGRDVTTCWLWTGYTSPQGYGVFRSGRDHTVSAHRFSYTSMIGEIPEGLQLDHLCRVRNCVNPWHLDPVTALVNRLRSPLLRDAHPRIRAQAARAGIA